jgi:hypothetical protein
MPAGRRPYPQVSTLIWRYAHDLRKPGRRPVRQWEGGWGGAQLAAPQPRGDGELRGRPKLRQPPRTWLFRAQKYCVLVISGYTSACSATGRGGNPRQNILRLDDPDESENTETVRFDVDGQGYEIDLAEADRQRFTSPRGVYLRQPVGRSRSRSLVAGGRRAECGASRQSDITQTREWAIGRNKDAAGVAGSREIDAYDESHR